MSQATANSNVELIERGYEAFNAADLDAVTAVMADDVEWTEPAGLPYAGTYQGPAAVVENVFGRVAADVDGLELDVERIVDGGDTLVVIGTARGTVRETGERLDCPFAHVCDFEDGRLSRFVQYTDTAIWRQAVDA